MTHKKNAKPQHGYEGPKPVACRRHLSDVLQNTASEPLFALSVNSGKTAVTSEFYGERRNRNISQAVLFVLYILKCLPILNMKNKKVDARNHAVISVSDVARLKFSLD